LAIFGSGVGFFVPFFRVSGVSLLRLSSASAASVSSPNLQRTNHPPIASHSNLLEQQMAQADRDTFDDWANKKAASTSAGLASAFGADDGRKKAPDKNNKQKCNKPSNIIISIDSSPSTNGDDDEV